MSAMRIRNLVAAVCVGILCGCAGLSNSAEKANAADTVDLITYVDPIIGAGGHGHVFVGPSAPFGAITPGPSNIHKGWDWCSGYHYSDTVMKGFSHLHLNGTGCPDLGDILIMPFTGPIRTEVGTQENPQLGYASRYTHKTETVRPDYYAVTLDDHGVKVELTATERVAMHRYVFPADKPGQVIIDLQEGNSDGATETGLKQIDATTWGGYRYSQGWARDQRVFFVLTVQTAPKAFSLYEEGKKLADAPAKSNKLKGVLSFAPSATPLLLKVAISPVSVENALANMKAEMNHWDFDKVMEQSRQKWNAELGKIKIDSKQNSVKRTFYTALYHTMITPCLFNDSNGDYRGTDKKVYTNPGFQNYSIFSLWDTYRAEHPLLTITQPQRVNDMVKAMLAIYQQQKMLPIWHLMGNETETMVGYHAVPVMVDAYFKGLGNFDPEEAFAAMKASAMIDRKGVNYIKEKGYIPGDKETESVAKALEYAIDDACIAMMAKALGKQEDYQYFARRADYFRTYFDAETQFMRGKMDDGSWRNPFDPVASKHREDDYCEGNAWQYTWLVPQAPEQLIKLFGSDEAFIQKLDQLFTVSSQLNAEASVDITGLIGQYAHGNEPGHHITYLYAFAGQPWKTAAKVRYIMSTMYNDTPEGLCGNEDCGQMSAWYVLSALGFYPVHPANGVYVLGSPAIDGARIAVAGNKEFAVEVRNNSDKNIYIQSMTCNGKPYSKGYITHTMIVNGDKLVIEMGPEPGKSWAVNAADRPSSTLNANPFAQ